MLACVLLAAGCGFLPYDERPAAGYQHGSGAPLVVAVVDETGDPQWSAIIAQAVGAYTAATPQLRFVSEPGGAHIVVTVRTYVDRAPPALPGYVFPAGAGGFAAVYDVEGRACNYPPTELRRNCSGEIARAGIYVSRELPPGPDLPARRLRLMLHELGHAMGLTRHTPTLDIATLAARYGWDAR
jgi:hypothetical protein